jgi:hypothetical protein
MGVFCGVRILSMYKNKATPLAGHNGLYGCEVLGLPHCLEYLDTYGDKAMSHTRRPRSNMEKCYFPASGINFQQRKKYYRAP